MSILGEYWGKYLGWEIYKYYNKDIKAYSKKAKDYIFAEFGDGGYWRLWRDGYIVGKANIDGSIIEFDPERPKREREKEKEKVMFTSSTLGKDDTDKILENAMKRSVEELVGAKFSE